MSYNRLAIPEGHKYAGHRERGRDFAIHAYNILAGESNEPVETAAAYASLALYWQGEANAEALLQIETTLNASL